MNQASGRRNLFEASPWKAIAGLSIPSLVSIAVLMLYNMADLYFVAKQNDISQIAAVSLASPVFSVLMAISTMIGNGGCTRIAQAMGRQDRESVRRCTAAGFWASIGLGLVFAVLSFLFISPLLGFLGTSEETREFTRSYLLIMAAGAPLVLLNHSLGGMLRGEGLVNVGLAGSMVSTFANILLDPLFILTFRLGAAGAAIATVLANAIAVLYILVYRARHQDRCILEMRLSYGRDLSVLGGILALGLPNAVSSLLSGFAGTFSNRLLAGYGTAAIAAMAAAGKATLLITMVQMGICMGLQPLLAYCYGAKDWKRLREITIRLLGLSLGLGLTLSAAVWLMRGTFIGLFLHDGDTALLAERLVRHLLLTAPVTGIYYLSTNFLQAAGNAAGATVASAMRQGLLLIPMLYLMEHLFGLEGLAAAHPCADAVSILVTALAAVRYYRKVSGLSEFSGEETAAGLPL